MKVISLPQKLSYNGKEAPYGEKSTGHTVYQQIRRVSVLGILVAMVLATGAGLSLNLLQERRIRDDTLTTAVQAVSHTLTITNADDVELVMEYVDRTVHGISGIDLFAVYDTDGTPVYFCDITNPGMTPPHWKRWTAP